MMMDDSSEDRSGSGLLAALRPALPAIIGAAALTFLFAAVIPMAWVAAISWNLYLDRLTDLFVPPVGNGARLALALGMAVVAALIAGIVALLVTRPEETGMTALRQRLRRSERDDGAFVNLPPRRRADFHPDDAPRPPLYAGRDLPAEGLLPAQANGNAADDRWVVETAEERETEFELRFASRPEQEEEELVLAALAPPPEATGDEPWLQPAEIDAGPILPDPADKSLGAMVARFEAGLARRREIEIPASTPLADIAANEDMGDPVDFALEAALGTLQRMNRHAVG